MRQVTQNTWADHCARWATYDREFIYSGSSTLLETFISTRTPGPGQEKGKSGAIVGRVEYRPDGTRLYFIC